MARSAELSVAAELRASICDPPSPGQRGTNEDTNGLLRQYFPSGIDLNLHGPDDLEAVAAALDGRPRKSPGWKTLAEALDAGRKNAETGRVATTG